MFSVQLLNAISLESSTEDKAMLSFHRSDPIIIRNDESRENQIGRGSKGSSLLFVHEQSRRSFISGL